MSSRWKGVGRHTSGIEERRESSPSGRGEDWREGGFQVELEMERHWASGIEEGREVALVLRWRVVTTMEAEGSGMVGIGFEKIKNKIKKRREVKLSNMYHM